MYATLNDNGPVSRARRLAESLDGKPPSAESGGTVVLTEVLEDQVCAEAGVWAPEAARRALDQAAGDIARAVALVRVWAATLPAIEVVPVGAVDVTLRRRVSAAFDDVPGGQWLGLTREFGSRLLRWDDAPATGGPSVPNDHAESLPAPKVDRPPTRAGCPRVRDLLAGLPVVAAPDEGDGPDPIWSPLTLPVARGARLAALARAETGALVAVASLILATRREAVLAEATVGVAALRRPHPRTGRPCRVADVPVVEAEAILDAEADGRPGLALGWGVSLGGIERRALAAALLDGALQADSGRPGTVSIDDATVLGAVDGPATTGFVEHLRLPHYASFASYLAQLTGAGLADPGPGCASPHHDEDDELEASRR